MLILTRRVGETILIGDDIEVVVLEVKGGQARIGIAAPKHVNVMRPDAKVQLPKLAKAV